MRKEEATSYALIEFCLQQKWLREDERKRFVPTFLVDQLANGKARGRFLQIPAVTLIALLHLFHLRDRYLTYHNGAHTIRGKGCC
jgi:hypothetical protein